MGCPDIYYKKALQLFAHCLNYKTDKKQARLLYAEESENVLEEEIRRQRDRLSVKEFYYLAGRTTEHVLSETDKNDGCEGINACLGGVYEFECFIGINEKE